MMSSRHPDPGLGVGEQLPLSSSVRLASLDRFTCEKIEVRACTQHICLPCLHAYGYGRAYEQSGWQVAKRTLYI